MPHHICALLFLPSFLPSFLTYLALLAAAASDSAGVDQHDGQSDKDGAKGTYYYPYSAATNSQANCQGDDQQSKSNQ
jgi:hypothetical protein